MTRLTGTTPDEVLLSVKRRIIDVVADGTESSVYLSTVPTELPPNAAEFMYEVAFSGGQTVGEHMAGGGTDTLHIVGTVVVSIHSTIQTDEPGRDDVYLASEKLGVLPRATRVLAALAVHDLEDEAGQQILSQPMRPVDTQIPPHSDRRRGYTSIAFAVEFDWDIGRVVHDARNTRLPFTTPDAILNRMKKRIVNCIAGAKNNNVYLSTLPETLPPNSGEVAYELYLSGGKFDQEHIGGGGTNTLQFVGNIHLTIHSTNQLDETGRDEIFLTDSKVGLIPRATDALRTLAIHDLRNSAGREMLSEPMRPTEFVIPPKDDRKRGVVQLTFEIRFDWNADDNPC